ncbi:sulfite exporter TauE/SafE family protein [Serratia sp. NPDC078593]|uniref:sulfite exporter TauE/SafE family protein n=1 Tax=unclassified Serratia (in: enterobacteria) TaxID=2647522 RepID=UPI0037CD772B
MLAIISVFFLAGIVKGIIGLGLPTISMGLLTLAMSPASAASLLIIPSLVTNIWQLFIGPAFLTLIKRLWGFITGIFIGTLFSVLPGLTATASWTETALGVVLIIYGLSGLIAKKLPSPGRLEQGLSPLVGYITGSITAATGVFVIPAVPYLQSLQLNKNDLVQSLGLAFTASTIALAIHLSLNNELESVDYYLSTIALIPAIIGMYAGQFLRNIISELAFRRCFFVALLILGAYMAIE